MGLGNSVDSALHSQGLGFELLPSMKYSQVSLQLLKLVASLCDDHKYQSRKHYYSNCSLVDVHIQHFVAKPKCLKKTFWFSEANVVCVCVSSRCKKIYFCLFFCHALHYQRNSVHTGLLLEAIAQHRSILAQFEGV